MKCPNCKKDLILPNKVYINLETYDVGGSKLISSECCGSGFIVKMNVSFKVTPYIGDKTEDDLGFDINKLAQVTKN